MSEENVSQHWKREENGATTNCGGFYTKTNVALANRTNESTSSSFSIPSSGSGPVNLSGPEMFLQQQQQQQQQPPPQQLLLPQHHQNFEKVTSISKINSLARISGFDGITQMPEEEKLRRFQRIVEAGIGDHAKQQILQILDKVSLLKPPERLLLYLRMPGGTPETDPLRQPQNPLGTRSEINHTINWVRSHLEHDPKVSIPKQDVYNDYMAYCERVDIKPLSTADFGKVMKQVFPEIRPRRLGTRGHSRYCYAAMRKATKLDSPSLPDLDANSNITEFSGVMDEDSWKVVKAWAEGLLNSNFSSLKDLASYLTKHHTNSPASNSSRLLLQKKLLQRDAKEKRKFTDGSPMKKRRKKKRRSSSSSESAQMLSLPADRSSLVDIKQEVMDTTQPQLIDVQPSSAMSVHLQQHLQQQQVVPMNLVTEPDNNNMQKIQGTNLACDTNLVVGCSTKNLVAPNLSPICAASIKDSPKRNINFENSTTKSPLNSVKEEISDDYHSKIYCKKVRQAQQAKGLWNPSSNTVLSTGNAPILQAPALQNSMHSYTRINDGLMGPPAQMDISSDHSIASGFKRSSLSNGTPMTKSSSPNLQLRAKKHRFINARMEALQEEQPTAVKDGTAEIVLTENLGIPRERVISICNMDKHELDDYLNAEENSQDQEAELLQYFQPEDSDVKSNSSDTGSVNMGTQSMYPVLENYQLYGNSKIDKKAALQNEDDINQLRFYLQQNLQNNNKDVEGQMINKSPMEQSGSYSGLYPGGSASASLAMMSQRHHSIIAEDQVGLRCCVNLNTSSQLENTLNSNNNNNTNNNTTSIRGPRRKINLNTRSCVPNSPNIRRKNFSFVPISPNSSTQSNSIDYSPFVSPRITPVVRKPPLHKQHSLPASDHHNLNDPMIIGVVGNSFAKNSNFSNTISSSAPPSPSLVQQRFRFAPTSTQSSIATFTTSGGLGNELLQFNHFQSVDMQCRIQNMSNNNCNLDGSGECRSQSVPLHCRNSPAFNHSNNFAGFSSACSSVAQTPVPTEFADFSDPSSILDIFGDSSQPPIKLETNDIAPSLLDDIASNESSIGVRDLLSHEFENNNNSIHSISRSVPSTPLSYKINNINNCEQDKINKMYDISKSVPTTPIAMNVSSFRYSPEFNRDFLINGNTIDSAKVTSFYNRQQQQQQQPSAVAPPPPPSTSNDSVADKIIPTSLPENIDELSNFGVTESIIGSDILNNL